MLGLLQRVLDLVFCFRFGLMSLCVLVLLKLVAFGEGCLLLCQSSQLC